MKYCSYEPETFVKTSYQIIKGFDFLSLLFKNQFLRNKKTGKLTSGFFVDMIFLFFSYNYFLRFIYIS